MSQADSADTTTLSGAEMTAALPAPAGRKSPGKSRAKTGTQTARGAAQSERPGDVVIDLLALVDRLARDRSVNPEHFDRILDVLEHQKALAAEQAFNRAMAEAQAEMEPVRADCRNDQTRSKYASLAALDAAIRPAYTRHGFSVSFDTEEVMSLPQLMSLIKEAAAAGIAVDLPAMLHEWKAINDDAIRVVTLVSHSYDTPAGGIAGHTRRYSRKMPCDTTGLKGNNNMTRTHAVGSAESYGRRYGLAGAFNLAVDKDDDGNAAGRRPAMNAAPAHRTFADRPPDNPQITRQQYARTVAPSPQSRLRDALAASAILAEREAQPVNTVPTFIDRRAAADIPPLAPRRRLEEEFHPHPEDVRPMGPRRGPADPAVMQQSQPAAQDARSCSAPQTYGPDGIPDPPPHDDLDIPTFLDRRPRR